MYILKCLILLLLVMSVHGDIEVSIDEEVSPGMEVTRLPAHRTAYGNLSAEQIQLMTYAILGQNSPPASFFKIDPRSGIVTVASKIDRENVCDPSPKCSVKVNIAIQSGSLSQVPFSTVVTLDVTINDVNDNPPRFPARDVTLDIPEGAKVGTELKISGAVDRDSRPIFTVQHYNISPAVDTFTLRPSTNLDGSSTINLRLEKELDRESTDKYVFNIMAYDGGSNPQSDHLKVTIRVTDDNDNVPRFDRPRYEMTVNENEHLGARVGQVRATDDDSGDFGRITYSLSSSSEQALKGVFTINSSSGWISVSGDLRTLRRTSPILMYVDAKDGGDPPLSSQTLVSVLIINSGNNPPYVRVNTVAATDVSALTIPESATLDHFVAFIDVDDNDEGDNGKVTCQILTSSDFKLSPVQNKGYTLLLNTEVDRERSDSYQIQIVCKDGGSPALDRNVTLTVNVTDINDNTPKFSSNLYTGAIDENKDPGQFIVKATAYDDDVGQNADITYSVQSEALKYIKINSKTGDITTNAPLDREKIPNLRFKIFAADGGEIPRTGVAEISITIRDINDNSPQFNQSKFIFSVSEHAPANTTVGTLTAHDLDMGANGQFDFYFGGSSSSDVPLPFNILKNGSIQVAASLDRETKGQFSLTALVRDRGEIPRSSSVPVEVKILDENDNDPIILFPTSRNHTIVVSSYPENGMVLGRIIAYDVDEEDAAKLRYFIYDGNDDGVFSMSSKNGELILQNVGRLQNPQEYQLSIKVEDSPVKPRNATTQLRIEIMFDNATGPLSQSDSGDGSRDQYVIIVGVIGGATVVLSAIIISAIIIILRSEKNRRGPGDASSVKNKFFAPAVDHSAQNQKRVEGVDVTKSQSNSSLGSDGQGFSPGKQGNKPDDVQKKVSFSLQNEAHTGGQGHMPEKHLRLNLSPTGDMNTQWNNKFNNPDDISSDTSGESGTCDSGRGTSEEDIKFDYLLHRGQGRTGEHYVSPGNRSLDQFLVPNPVTSRSAPNIPGQGRSHLENQNAPANPGHARFMETAPGRHHPPQVRSTYHCQRQPPLSSFASGVPTSTRHPPNLKGYRSGKDNSATDSLLRPPSAMSYTRQGSAVSIDDDASTTTSGSYIISPDDVRLDGFLDQDVVV